MSSFSCKVVPITIHPHPNAEKLELAQVADYRCVVGKGLYQSGDLVAYIPEASIVPEWALKHFGYWNEEKNQGLLTGKNFDRVKAIKLRDQVSQGIVFPVRDVPEKGIKSAIAFQGEDGKIQHQVVNVGDNVAELLGITKWEPPIPFGMGGEVYNAGYEITVNYDIENLKWYPNVLVEGEEVIFTEKLHGTSFQIGLLPVMDKYYHDDHFHVKTENGEGYFFIGSKGLGAQGLCFKDVEANVNNVYVRAAHQFKLFEKLLKLCNEMLEINGITNFEEPVILQGEVFGAIQDLTYGAKPGEIFFRAFDICVGERSYRRYFDEEMFAKAMDIMELDRCPVLYKGPYSKEKILELTHHTKSKVCPDQISEGGVVKPTKERKDQIIPTMGGRVILKSISEDYLLRKNGSEFN